MLALILALLGIIIGFFTLELGFIFEFIAFFIARKEMKNKEKYSKSAYYISLIVGILQFIVWIAVMAYTFIYINKVIDDGNNKLNEINTYHETKLEITSEYYLKCSDKYDKYEDYDNCINKINECFDTYNTYEQLEQAKQCVYNLKIN